ncbi:sigma-70 family RNA polymerase sigma factor [Kribbella antibiotica]|uniref:Sigma-70 family RNA polymerase sigma factor n=1 Tax=Kribbella antibiotica TaxID=190195 RepID=A0A4R4ZWY1_9ACTN|nr:sigma-70 family RNA polymerase sigma factor [Kribbella antibiotica]TDD62639.1 sigma-70 family RNA polymerase sigma factor [Kribbella antibiotica]
MTKPGLAEIEQLYQTHYRAVLRYLSRRTESPDAAADLAAEVFLVAWRRRSELPWNRALPWLYRVASYELANRRRSARRATAAYMRVGNDLATQTSAEPGEQIEWSAELGDTLTALRELSAPDQEVLRLAAWEELHGKDLAVALGCSTTAAAMRLHRARRRLRAALHDPVVQGSAPVITSQQGEHA